MGAWVEIKEISVAVKVEVMSRPARGAWVEIETGVLPLHHPAVAPRKGRVG